MNRPHAYAVFLLVSVLTLVGSASADVATPTSDATPFACPITKPNGNEPPTTENVAGRGDGGYGNSYLWTTLWMWGRDGVALSANDSHVSESGELRELKWAWYRYVEGDLTIEGRRIDADAPPLTARVPDGYGNVGFQPAALTFPTAGCWEVTGHLDGGTLTFVVRVQILDRATPVASPA